MLSLHALKALSMSGLVAWCRGGLRVAGRHLSWSGLIALLVLAPVLGQMHRIHHPVWRAGPATAQPEVMVDRLSAEAAEAAPAGLSRWLDRLFSHHSGDADCLVYDQLSHDGPPQSLKLVDPGPALSHFLPWWLDATLVAATAAPCQARAPPASR